MSSPLPDEPPHKTATTPFLSDLLPPALVLDMRQSLNAPINLVLAIIGILLIYSTVLSFTFQSLFILMLLHALLLFAFIPFRAGQKIARDIRERGSNFLKLCPLSAGRIVWGQFLSCSLQLLLITLPLIPLYYLAVSRLMTDKTMQSDVIAQYALHVPSGVLMFAALIIGAAMVMTAFMMALAILPLMFRILLQTGVILFLILSWISHYVQICYLNLEHHAPGYFNCLTGQLIVGLVFLMVISAIFLILASRYYSSHVEASSGRLRLLLLLCLVGFFATFWYYDWELDRDTLTYLICGGFFIPYLAIILMDELLPNESAAGISPRRRGLLGYLTRRTTGANMIALFVLAAVYCAGAWFLIFGRTETSIITPYQGSAIDTQIMCLMTAAIAWIYSTLSALVVSDICLPRSSRYRLLGFGMGLIILMLAGQLVTTPSYMPFHCIYHTLYDFNYDAIASSLVRMAGACAGSLFLLAVVHAIRKA